MDNLTRRSFLKPRVDRMTGVAATSGIAGAPMSEVAEGTSRRAFLQGTAGAAAGAAVILATPKVAAIALDDAGSSAPVEPQAVATKPSGAAPYEPVTAYVRDAEHGEVTVMFGKSEATYRDPVLVRRLLDAAR